MLPSNLDQILADLRPAAGRLAAKRRRRFRLIRAISLGLGLAGCAASAAVGAVAVFGGPAPPAVKRDLAAVDQGMPEDLRLNPDVENARSAAVSANSVVYFAKLAGGGYCAELVTSGRGRGAVCSTAGEADAAPLSVTVPFDDPVTMESPVVVSGHVSLRDAETVELVYPDGGLESVTVTPDRFYVAEVARAHLASVHALGLLLVARDGDGEALAQTVVPHDAITPLSESERPKDPIEVETVTDHGDLTRILRIRGTVHDPGATTLRLRYPGGQEVSVDLRGGRFDLRVPQARRGSFADSPGTLRALDASGAQTSSRPVAAVSYWRQRELTAP